MQQFRVTGHRVLHPYGHPEEKPYWEKPYLKWRSERGGTRN
jgi:hypothetical protein